MLQYIENEPKVLKIFVEISTDFVEVRKHFYAIVHSDTTVSSPVVSATNFDLF